MASLIRWLAEDWKCTVVRLAMGADNQGGYLENPSEKNKVITCVDAAIAAGIYVVIDWHDHTAEDHVDQARGFFNEMASRYANVPNVMYETYNEPLQVPWSTIKWYHEQIVPVIRAHTQNVIILGTRSWSQEVDVAAGDPVPGVNLAYTIHFYANTHRGELRARVDTAKARGVAVFATEWGTCNADGNGQLDLPSTNTWLNFFKGHHISDANWAIADKNEACAALTPGASSNGGWSSGELSASGNFIRNSIRGDSGGGGGGGSGCCRFGADCGDCGDDGTGWCHQSASNCATCTGSFDPSGPSPGCGGGPSPSPLPTPPGPNPGPSPPAPAGSVVEQHGALRVSGNDIVGSHGSPVLLRGMSMFWSQWMDKYWNADVIRWLAEDWKCTVVRLAMGADNQGGYLENPAEKNKVITCVDAAIAAGIYVVIDWHDHTAEDHVDQAW